MLLLAIVSGSVADSFMPSLIVILVALAINSLMKTYENHSAVTKTYAVGFYLSIATMLWFPSAVVLVLVPILMWKPLSSISFRTFFALIVGFLSPLWIILPVIFLRQFDHLILGYVNEVMALRFDFDYSSVSNLLIIAYIVLVLLLIVLGLRYSRLTYKGNVSVRAQHRIYVILAWLFSIAAPFLPRYLEYFVPLMILMEGPLVALQVTRESR